MSDRPEETLSHEQAFDLLPWYVTDTLSDAEAAGVRAHLRSCLVCRRELEAQQCISGLVADAEMVPLKPHRSFQALMARVDAQESARESARSGVGRWLAWTTAPLPIAAGLSALVLIGILTVLFGTSPDEPAYRTLAQDVDLEQHATPLLRVIFAESVEQSEALRVVSELGVDVVAGPNEVRAYTIRVEEGDVDRVLETLRTDARVRFAERTYIAPDHE